MKLTFEGVTIEEIAEQMTATLHFLTISPAPQNHDPGDSIESHDAEAQPNSDFGPDGRANMEQIEQRAHAARPATQGVDLSKVPPVQPALPGAGNAAEFDDRGYPWDERIHAATKTKNKDGSWRYKRGIDKTVIEAVEAETKPATGQPAPVPVPTTEPAAAPATIPVPTGEPAPAPADDPLAIPAYLQRQPAPAPAVITYQNVVDLMTAKITEEKVTEAELMPDGPFWVGLGLKEFNDLQGNQAAIDATYAKLQALG